mmetsp:Transcript_28032/g.39482  ORF Transcript_28032/g.39482 Transcript_28032/m.39482 type:complete len:292 (-) Transcript_28032:102-977(-)
MNKKQREREVLTRECDNTGKVMKRGVERGKSEPILKVGEQSVDLSNLCLTDETGDTEPAQILRRQQTMPPKRTSMHNLYDEPLYPSREDFPSISLEPVEGMFCEPKASFRSTDAKLKPIDYRTDQRVGAFPETISKSLLQDPKKSRPPLPTWVDSSNRKPAAKPTPLSSEKVSSRHEVEVAPGKYMPLRGATETLAAVNNGTSRLVGCLACQTSLRCVPDAELVICPVCRILSPVCSDDEADYSSSGSACEDEMFLKHTPDIRRLDRLKKIFKSQEWVGGVGLGYKVEFHC